MKIKNIFLAALAAAFTFASCEPADPETPQTPDQEETPGDNENSGDTEKPSTPSDTFQAGQYWITGTKDGATKVMMPLAEDKTFGYPSSEVFANNASYADNVFTFAAVEGGFTICDASGRYYYQEAGTTYKTFSVGTDGTLAGCVWTVAKNDDNTYTITNAASGKIVRYAEGTYTSFGVYAESEFNGSVAVNLVPAANAQTRPVLDGPATASVENNVTTYSVEVESNLAWTATAGTGVTLDKTSGNGNATVVLTFAANTGDAAVTYTVTFTAGELTKTFTLTQNAAASEGASTITLTDSVLPTAYPTTETIVKVGTYELGILNVANYGNGVQVKKETGYIANKTDNGKIKSIKLTWNPEKSFYPTNIQLSVGASADAVSTVAEQQADDSAKTVTYDLSSGNYNFFKISNTSTYAVYFSKVEIVY